MEAYDHCRSWCYYSYRCGLLGPIPSSIISTGGHLLKIGAVHRMSYHFLIECKAFSNWMRWRGGAMMSSSLFHPIFLSALYLIQFLICAHFIPAFQLRVKLCNYQPISYRNVAKYKKLDAKTAFFLLNICVEVIHWFDTWHIFWQRCIHRFFGE